MVELASDSKSASLGRNMQVFQSSVPDNNNSCVEDRQKSGQYTFLVGIPPQGEQEIKQPMESQRVNVNQTNSSPSFNGYFVPQGQNVYSGANGPLSYSETGQGYQHQQEYRFNPEAVRSKSVGSVYAKDVWSTSTSPYFQSNSSEDVNEKALGAGRDSRKSFTTGMNHVYERSTNEGSNPVFASQRLGADKSKQTQFCAEKGFQGGKSCIDDDSISSDLNPHAKAFVFAPSAQQEDSGDDSSGRNSGARKGSCGDSSSAEGMRRRRHSLDSLDFNAISVQDMPSFMRALRLHKYTETLASAGVDFAKLLKMDEEELEAVGVTTQGARRRLLLAVQKYCDYISQQSSKVAAISAQSSDSKVDAVSFSQVCHTGSQHASDIAELVPPPPGNPSTSVVNWSQGGKFFGAGGPVPRRERSLVSISEKSEDEVSVGEGRKKSLLCHDLSVPSTQYEVGTADEINELEHQMKQQEEQLLDWIKMDDV